MKLLVFAHRLELGGTQVNAIELAAALRDTHGYEVTLHATPGPALALVRAHGLDFVPAPDARFHPAPGRIRALRALARRVRPDLIQAWDWWQGLEAYAGLHLTTGLPMVLTDMMMDLTPAMPRGVPTTFGFEDLRARAAREGWRRTHLLLPPVDTIANAPNTALAGAFRQSHAVTRKEVLLVAVSRLAKTMKSDGLARAIEAVRVLGAEIPLKLLIVGEGEARPALQRQADAANRQLDRAAVGLVGAMDDPRPAYAAADIVLGMGGSALRGLAHSVPVIVLGETGFSRLFTPGSASGFQRTGMFGRGDGRDDALAGTIRRLCMDPDLRAELGAFGRAFVMRHHGLGTVAGHLAHICEDAMAAPRPATPARVADAARAAFWYLRERRFRVASRDAGGRAPAALPGQDPLRT